MAVIFLLFLFFYPPNSYSQIVNEKSFQIPTFKEESSKFSCSEIEEEALSVQRLCRNGPYLTCKKLYGLTFDLRCDEDNLSEITEALCEDLENSLRKCLSDYRHTVRLRTRELWQDYYPT